MIYLGQLGRMVGLKCPASQQITVEDATSFKSTLEGKRLAQVSQDRGRRSWQCQLSDASTPDQVGAVMSFINREWGIGPFIFVSADAPVTNLFTTDAASCDPAEFIPTSGSSAISTGPMLTPDGWAGRSFSKDVNNGLFLGKDLLPVIPGQRVTVSAYVRGVGGAVQLAWRNAMGDSLGSVTSTVVAGTSNVVRSFVTALPPVGAVGFRVSVNSATTQVSRPAATWSDTLLPWADGQGCMKAIAHGASRDLILASRDPRGGRYSNLSFTVSEVG